MHDDLSTSAKALLVIDLQKAVLVDAIDVPGVIGRVNQLIDLARASATPIVFIQHQEKESPEMNFGSPTWEFVDELKVERDDVVVHKEHRDAFAATDLKAILDAEGVSELVITGAQSDFCVQTTALAALAHGFDIILVGDAHTTTDTGPGYGSVDAASVVEFINGHFYWLTYPGRTVSVVDTDQIEFS